MANMKSERRPYRQKARAFAAEETARRLVGAMQALFAERPYDDITLEAVARRAGVTLQTLLRRFGSKDGLLAAAAEEATTRIRAQRGEAMPGDVRGAVENLVDHYEAWGDVSLRLLAEEQRSPQIAALTRTARALHVAWVERVFAPELRRRRGRPRARCRAQLVAICDVYVWKVLRRDQRLSRVETEQALLGMVRAMCGEGP